MDGVMSPLSLREFETSRPFHLPFTSFSYLIRSFVSLRDVIASSHLQYGQDFFFGCVEGECFFIQG